MALIKIEIKHRWLGTVLFSYEKDENTIKDTLVEAVKQKADLRGADLRGAYLRGAYLRGAYLLGADLIRADLRRADLSGADLSGADLRWADLRWAYLLGADLSEADLSEADLRWADLREADLRWADLIRADLLGAKEVPFVPSFCPSDGAFIGWKKAWTKVGDTSVNVLVKLEIPADARRSSATSTKCRCDKAKVLEITRIDNGEQVDSALSNFNSDFVYTVGKTIEEPAFCEGRWQECAEGIHFFINKQEAIDY